eukprot:Protomagalhaensia_sp_Gyna_25__3674@NODE_32_length_7245_cov_75_898973_g22_i0_p9_GENE_NODE_32_length_7245_cov_75_898973_g22_i0NODE_32_length_7245_cov_75_898973_g22_i0_p9_ORF_typecomplete_len105_score2_18_NODE_32_length_7245_cov_75_898973_g22_i016501964
MRLICAKAVYLAARFFFFFGRTVLSGGGNSCCVFFKQPARNPNIACRGEGPKTSLMTKEKGATFTTLQNEISKQGSIQLAVTPSRCYTNNDALKNLSSTVVTNR